MTETLQRPAASVPPQPGRPRPPAAAPRRRGPVGAHGRRARAARGRAAGRRRVGERPPQHGDARRLRPDRRAGLADRSRHRARPAGRPVRPAPAGAGPAAAGAAGARRPSRVAAPPRHLGPRCSARRGVGGPALRRPLHAASRRSRRPPDVRPSAVSAGARRTADRARRRRCGRAPARPPVAGRLDAPRRTHPPDPSRGGRRGVDPAGRRGAARRRLAPGSLRPGDRRRSGHGPGRRRRRRPAAARAVVRAQRRRVGGVVARGPGLRGRRRHGRRAVRPRAGRRAGPAAAGSAAGRRGRRSGSAPWRWRSRSPPGSSPGACCTAGPTPLRAPARPSTCWSPPRGPGQRLAVLALLAGGPAGGARLAELGPSATRSGLAVAVEVAVGATAAVVLLRRRSGPAEQPGD